MIEWYWHKKSDTEPQGPVNEQELKELARTGELKQSDKVWRSGLDDWVKASEVSDLFRTPPAIKKNDSPTTDSQNIPSSRISKYDEPNKSKELSEPSSENKETTKTNSDNDLQGVGGWLTFFCVALTILGPMISIGNMISGWEEAKPVFEVIPKFETAIWIENIGISIITIYGFITGAMIWGGDKNGKTLAERYLVIRLFIFIGAELLVLMMLSDLPQEAYNILTDELTVAILREVFFFGVWFSYFKVSKRVKTTYLQNAT